MSELQLRKGSKRMRGGEHKKSQASYRELLESQGVLGLDGGSSGDRISGDGGSGDGGSGDGGSGDGGSGDGHGAREGLCRYAELLEQWSGRHNLVSFRSRQELVELHLGEAVRGLAVLEELGAGRQGARLVDIGSGGGIPAIPLLICAPRWQGLLLEPRQKRWAFLKLVVRELGLDAEVLQQRYQETRSTGSPVDLVTVRAVAVDEAMLRWAGLQLRPGGRVLVWTSAEVSRRIGELAERTSGWHVLSSPLASRETFTRNETLAKRENRRLVSLSKRDCFT